MSLKEDNIEDKELPLDKLVREITSVLLSFEDDSVRYDGFFTQSEDAHIDMHSVDDPDYQAIQFEKLALMQANTNIREIAIECEWPNVALAAVKQSKKFIIALYGTNAVSVIDDKISQDCIAISKLFIAEGNHSCASKAYNWCHGKEYNHKITRTKKDQYAMEELKKELNALQVKQATAVKPKTDFISVLERFQSNTTASLEDGFPQKIIVKQLDC